MKYIGLLRQVFSPFQSLHCAFKHLLYRAYVTSPSLEQFLYYLYVQPHQENLSLKLDSWTRFPFFLLFLAF